jgi:small subunit ribosomal protein S6
MIGANMPLYEHVFISRQDLSNAQAEGLVEHFSTVLRLHEDVMRVMTIKVDAHQEGPSVQMQKRDDRGERRERRA